jgi:uncharacterized protein (DUF58 family)
VHRPGNEHVALAERYALGLKLPALSGLSGLMKGRGTGSSTEFQDHRKYFAGDDIRKLDWRAYARTDQLMVKRYREEVRPTLELLVDDSKSVEQGKGQRVVDVVAGVARAAEADGFLVRLLIGGRRVGLDELIGAGLDFSSRMPLQELVQRSVSRLRPGSVRLLVSDFLSPHAATGVVRTLASGAGTVGLVQVLSAWDADPQEGGAMRLIDSETDEVIDLVLDGPTIRLYNDRLNALTEALREEARRAGGVFVRVRSDRALDEECSEVLVPHGLLAVR